MEAYILDHIRRGGYAALPERKDAYRNDKGWIDYRIGEHIVFAYRKNDYTADRFTDALHVHDYVEMILFAAGDVQYLSGSRGALPQEGSVVIIPPGKSHTTRLLREGEYTRYVLYFSPSAFTENGDEMLRALLQAAEESFTVTLNGDELLAANNALDKVMQGVQSGDGIGKFSAYSGITDLLTLIAGAFLHRTEEEAPMSLPENITAIRRYIEKNFASIASVDALAADFYYSREHLARLFRKYYNITPHDYIEQCRIREALRLLRAGERVVDVCYLVGYRSMSVFLAAFRRRVGSTPSAVRRISPPS